MRHIIITLLLSITAACAMGRTVSEKTILANRASRNELKDTRLDIVDDRIVFYDLPKSRVSINIVDAGGKLVATRTLSRRNNVLNMKDIPTGCNTITVQLGDNAKLFGYCTGVIVTAPGRVVYKEADQRNSCSLGSTEAWR